MTKTKRAMAVMVAAGLGLGSVPAQAQWYTPPTYSVRNTVEVYRPPVCHTHCHNECRTQCLWGVGCQQVCVPFCSQVCQ